MVKKKEVFTMKWNFDYQESFEKEQNEYYVSKGW